MPRYVDADAITHLIEMYIESAQKEAESISKSARLSLARWIADSIRNMPPEDVQPTRWAEWIPEGKNTYHCSRCGNVLKTDDPQARFCDRCGSKMRRDYDETD